MISSALDSFSDEELAVAGKFLHRWQKAANREASWWRASDEALFDRYASDAKSALECERAIGREFQRRRFAKKATPDSEAAG